MVVQRGQVQSREAIVLCLIDGEADREIDQDESNGSHVSPEGGMVEPMVASIQVNPVLGEQLQDVRLITKAGMVDSPITIFVLHMYMYTHNIVYNIAAEIFHWTEISPTQLHVHNCRNIKWNKFSPMQ